MIIDRPRTSPRRRPPSPRRGRLGTGGPASVVRGFAPYSWYDTVDLTSTGLQAWPNRVATGITGQMGSTTGVDTGDPAITLAAGGAATYATFDGTTDYVQLGAYDTPVFTGTTGAWTMLLCFATTTSSLGIMWSSEATTDNGALLFINNTAGTISGRIGGVGQAVLNQGTSMNSGAVKVAGLVVTPGSPSTFKVYIYGVGLSSSVNITAAPVHNAPRIGTRGSAVSFPYAGKMYSALQWNSAVAVADLNTISAALVAMHP